LYLVYFFFSSRRRHTRSKRDWSSDVCSSDLYDSLELTITAQQIYSIIIFTFIILTTTTSCSLSFEGDRVWIILVAPIDIRKIAFGKILINIFLFLPGIILTAVVYHLVFQVSILYLLDRNRVV